MSENPTRRHFAVHVGGTNYSIEHNIRHKAPQTLIDEHQKAIRPSKSMEEVYQRWDRAIPVIIEGFGKEAITQMQYSPSDPEHWKTVVNAFDLIAEGGVRKSEEAMSALRNLTKDNVKLAVEIQKAIQGKEKAKPQTVSPVSDQL